MMQAAETKRTTIDPFLREVAAVAPIDPAQLIGVGSVLDDCYELRERLGAGGMATVYRAYDRRLDREVAVKVPQLALRERDRDRVVAMFAREAQATARLSHPNIVALHHVGAHAGTPFAVLELLIGETLAARLARRHRLPLAELLPILDGVLAALAYAHERGYVHRDLTPRNVFLTSDQRVKLLDFGVAIQPGHEPGTRTRGAGTPGYMAPEHGDAPDPRTDLWAVGVLALECLTGRAGGPLAVPRELPAPVRAALGSAIAEELTARPATAAALRAALARGAPGSAPAPARRAGWPRRAAIAIGALAVAAAALFAGVPAITSEGDAAAPIAPRPGRWRGDPPAATPWETHLQLLPDGRYSYRQINRRDGATVEGTLELESLSDGTTLLSGKTRDVVSCRTCTLNVGFIEFIVLDELHLYQNRAAWGPSHDQYQGWFPPYRYKWEGALREGLPP